MADQNFYINPDGKVEFGGTNTVSPGSTYMTSLGNKDSAQVWNQIMVNQANADLAKQQNDWNIAQWERNNAYNSPANQVKLYEAAGLNPIMAAGNFNSSQAPTSSNLSNQVASAQFTGKDSYDKVSSILNGVTNVVGSSLEAMQNMAAIKQARATLDSTNLENDNRRLMNEILGDTKEYQKSSIKQDYLLKDVEHQQKRLENDEKTINLDILKEGRQYLSKMPKAQFERFVAETKVAIANGTILEQEADIAKKYGIREGSDWLTNLFMMGLKNPEAYNNAFDAILKALSRTVSGAGRSIGHAFNSMISRINPF